MGDNIHDKTDNRAAEMQPGSQKSLSSKIGDAVNPNVHTDGYNASGSTNATTSPRAVGEPTMMDKVRCSLGQIEGADIATLGQACLAHGRSDYPHHQYPLSHLRWLVTGFAIIDIVLLFERSL